MSDEQWFKVLVDGKSCHGGNMAWPLPTDNGDGTFTPGAWVEVGRKSDLRLCEVGLHLTTDPTRWLKVGGQAYRAEGKRAGERAEDKRVFGKARLLAPAPDAIPDYWRRVETFLRDDLPRWDFSKGTAWDQSWDEVWDQARDQARAQARDEVWAQVWGQVWDQVWDQVWGQARDQVWAQVWDQVWDQARDATLYCSVEVLCADLLIADEHRRIARSLRAHYVTEANHVDQ